MPQNEIKNKGVPVNKALLAVGDGVLGAAVLVMIGVYVGQFIDQKFNTAPWLSMILPLVGGGAGLARLVMKAINLDKDKAED